MIYYGSRKRIGICANGINLLLIIRLPRKKSARTPKMARSRVKVHASRRWRWMRASLLRVSPCTCAGSLSRGSHDYAWLVNLGTHIMPIILRGAQSIGETLTRVSAPGTFPSGRQSSGSHDDISHLHVADHSTLANNVLYSTHTG